MIFPGTKWPKSAGDLEDMTNPVARYRHAISKATKTLKILMYEIDLIEVTARLLGVSDVVSDVFELVVLTIFSEVCEFIRSMADSRPELSVTLVLDSRRLKENNRSGVAWRQELVDRFFLQVRNIQVELIENVVHPKVRCRRHDMTHVGWFVLF